MIVPMKKVLLLAVAEEKTAALEALRELGVMQISTTETPTRKTDYAATTLAFGKRISNELHQLAAAAPDAPEYATSLDGRAIIDRCGLILEHRAKLDAALDALKAQLKRLEPWGDFDRQLWNDLAAEQVTVTLCGGAKRDWVSARQLPDVAVCELSRGKGKIYYAVISRGEAPAEIPGAVLKLRDDDDPAALRDKIAEQLKLRAEYDRELAQFATVVERVDDALLHLAADWEFSLVQDSCSDHRVVISLEGFVPEFSLDALRDCAKSNGWGLRITEPAADENVPVLLKESKFEKLIQPLFNFLGILPGYREMDISGAVLIFFTIFYAMIIGDAGYGALFAVLTALATLRFRRKPAAKTPLKLAWILSITTVIWGVLTGSYFGVSYGGLPILAGEQRNAAIQIFCFLLAVAQLSLGHIWSAIHQRSWKSLGAHLGWTLIILANFFLAVRIIVLPGEFPQYMYYLYGIGFVLILLCGIKWRDAADVFQFPFSIIGSFSDMLSYIRLFAVGMSGAYIASNFNGMGIEVIKASPWFILGGVLVILFGHLLNISLAMMSVLVHAVRLNTLEFSNHTGLTWSGSAFHPFKNPISTNKKEE